MTTEPDLVTARREARARRRARARVRLAVGAVIGTVGLSLVAWAALGNPSTPPTPPGDSPSAAVASRATEPPPEAGGTVALAAGRARPRLVVVPALGVEAPVEPMHVVDGVLTPPSPATTVGWWDRSARPGSAKGTVVVAGHTVHQGGGAFDDLGHLVPGDRVVMRTKRAKTRYSVTRVETYDRDTLARKSSRIFRQRGKPRLVLITCEDWDGTSYLSNTVVYAVPLD